MSVLYQTHPFPFAIREPLPGVDLAAVSRLGWGVALWLSANDVDLLYSRLAASGARVVQPIKEGPFGRFFVVSDPDGYALTIHAG